MHADTAPVDTAARVLLAIGAAADRTTGSDELAAGVTDWATRHHLSRLRANLLRPLRLAPGMRVLDATGGSGALARYAAECGAEVVCLSGSDDAARAASARCDGLAVDVLPVAPDGFEDAAGFDVVLCTDGLDPSAVAVERLARLARPSGVLVVAVDNPVGVACLLGYDEHRFGEPWAGVSGRWPAVAGNRLRALLAGAGLEAQRWLLPFPDHRLPTAILHAALYEGEGTAGMVDQLVRWPCRRDPVAPLRVCDDRAAHRALVAAGLGPAVANSYLVVAGRTVRALDSLVDPGVRAWVFSGDRRRRFLGWKAFGAGAVQAERAEGGAEARSGWLSQVRVPEQAYQAGPTVEQLALDACADGEAALAAVLGRWRAHLRAVESVAADDDEPHPFRTPRTTSVLPADHIDVNLPNFVVDADGGLRYVDDEWRAPSPVDADLVCTRALWWFAVDVVHRGVTHPWPAATSVDELTAALAGCAGQAPVDPEELRASEAALQARVSGLPLEYWNGALAALGRARQTDPALTRRLPLTALRATVAELAADGADHAWRLDDLRDRNRELVATAQVARDERQALDEELREVGGRLAEASDRVVAAEGEVARVGALLAEERAARAAAEEALDGLRRSRWFPLYRWLAGRHR